jgi:hypothetical protein
MQTEHHGKFHFNRREFLKTTTLAGVAVTLPCKGVFKQDIATVNSWYERLANALNALPNSFPRTKSNIEITLLKKILPGGGISCRSIINKKRNCKCNSPTYGIIGNANSRAFEGNAGTGIC